MVKWLNPLRKPFQNLQLWIFWITSFHKQNYSDLTSTDYMSLWHKFLLSRMGKLAEFGNRQRYLINLTSHTNLWFWLLQFRHILNCHSNRSGVRNFCLGGQAIALICLSRQPPHTYIYTHTFLLYIRTFLFDKLYIYTHTQKELSIFNQNYV